jgi:hypothetical protein
MDVSYSDSFRPACIRLILIKIKIATPSVSVVANGAGFSITGDPVAFNAKFGGATTLKLFLDLVVPPPSFTTYTATINVADTSNNFLSYVDTTLSTFGGFAQEPVDTSALKVTFQLPVGASTASNLNILTTNLNGAFQDIPQFGGNLASSGYILGSGIARYENIRTYLCI